MKKIGRGWQYTVYDLENGRVLKKYNRHSDSFFVMLKDAITHIRLPLINFFGYYSDSKKYAEKSLKLIKTTDLPQSMFGNPLVLDRLAYEQDYVTSLSKFFQKEDLDKSMKKIDECVAFVKKLYSIGIAERYFNIPDNFGINDKGEVILIDLGEICTDLDEIKRQIEKRVWSAPDVLSKIPVELHTYYIDRMNREFNV